MRKLAILVMVLGMASSVFALGTLTLRVDPAQAKPVYEIGDVITIQIYASGFGTNTTGRIGVMSMDSINTTNNAIGTASNPAFNSHLWSGTACFAGNVVNAGGILLGPDGVNPIRGARATTDTVGVYEGICYSFDFRADSAGTTQISWMNLSVKNIGGAIVLIAPDVPPILNLTVIPEPMTIALLGLGGMFLRGKTQSEKCKSKNKNVKSR